MGARPNEGNRLAYTTDLNNELTNDGTYAYTHDNEGNRKTKIGAGLTATYTWDHRNRLTKVESTVSSTTTTVEYTYDLMDRRIERKVNSSATHRWGYDGDAIALEFDGSNTLTHRYLHGPGIDQVFADEQGANTYWALTDHLGTVRDLVNNSGTNVKHIQYDTFGKRLTTPGGVEILYNWTGREYDVETELQYNRARWYDAKVGRWLSADPIGFDAGDSNLYRYVNNQPTIDVDPSGLAGSGSKKGSIGADNAVKVAEDLAKNHKGTRFWRIVFSDQVPEQPTDALQARQGHAWIAAVDTKDISSLVSKGFYPAEGESPDVQSPKCKGVFKDDSKRKFVIARAYPLIQADFTALTSQLSKLSKEPPEYHVASKNCATMAAHLGNLSRVPLYDANVGEIAGIRMIVPRNLSFFLKLDSVKGSVLFEPNSKK